MRALRRLFLFVFVVLLVVVTTVIVTRVSDGQEVGPPATICPGPDEFGYVCEAGGAAYIDATNDTHLYQDDDLVALDLPFTFSFYGTQYDALLASSNGNLQFSTENSAYANECLAPRPVAGMGDLIAPYWDDLDLSFRGFLQTEVVGETPERIFVVEWDGVPRFSSRDDLLTFEVQLFESSNDIVFLYRDARTLEGASGSQATIGIQSENQGYALQVSCDQHAVDDGNMIRFPYPGEPPADAGLSYVPRPSLTEARRPALEKGQGAAVVDVLNT